VPGSEGILLLVLNLQETRHKANGLPIEFVLKRLKNALDRRKTRNLQTHPKEEIGLKHLKEESRNPQTRKRRGPGHLLTEERDQSLLAADENAQDQLMIGGKGPEVQQSIQGKDQGLQLLVKGSNHFHQKMTEIVRIPMKATELGVGPGPGKKGPGLDIGRAQRQNENPAGHRLNRKKNLRDLKRRDRNHGVKGTHVDLDLDLESTKNLKSPRSIRKSRTLMTNYRKKNAMDLYLFSVYLSKGSPFRLS